jgi:hypothetical protein
VIRWIVAPLLAATALGLSGFLDALENTTESSAELARASSEAPRTTQRAAEELEGLPVLADLSVQQSDAFRALADALEVSARRAVSLNESVDAQARRLRGLASRLASLAPSIDCARSRLRGLVETSAGGPAILRAITSTLGRIIAAQDKSVRHLRSINRKLTALGVAAAASGVEPPPPPPAGAGGPRPGPPPGPRQCR